VGKCEGKEPLGMRRYIWEVNIRNVSLKNGGAGGGEGSVYRIDLPQDRDTWLTLVKTVLNLWVP
jgi:hypothetical protein